MLVEEWIKTAKARGASDLHLEPGQPATLRVLGELCRVGEPIAAQPLADLAHDLLGEGRWGEFLEQRSHDLSLAIAGVRCRINVMQTARGVGLAIRLLAPFRANLDRLNLHPDLRRFTLARHGLVVITGPTGSGKNSTLAAFVNELAAAQACHIISIEQPIEYAFAPNKALIRQREVGRDTPSFEQALVDAMREDPNVLVVGEMRTPEVIRLTLGAAETGHLVFATMHSATPPEAIGRIISAFAPETQSGVAAQLADCLVGVVCQRLVFDAERQLRVPECAILVANHPTQAIIRSRELFKLASAMETGRDDGMWTFERYRRWLQQRTAFYVATRGEEAAVDEPAPTPDEAPLELPRLRPPTAADRDRAGHETSEAETVEQLISQLSK